MGLWIDDTLSEQDRWLDMSAEARACLIDLWLYCRRAKNDGVIKEARLKKASDLLTASVRSELIDQHWMHRGGKGCGTDTCPKGIAGVVVMHDYLQHQESARDMTTRIDRGRELSKRGNHKRWHIDRGIVDPDCRFCDEETS